MALSPITRPVKLRDFSVYDLEWIPHTLELRVVGTYDGHEYRSFLKLEDFLNFALSSRNRGRWFYAHAGGLFDVQFILDHLIRKMSKEYEIDAKFSGSSAIIVKVRRGKNCWFFVDSYWLLRAPLREIGEKMVGKKKGGLDPTAGYTKEEIEEYYRSTPIAELIEYNKLDCEILYEGIAIFQESLLALGGQLQMTLASSAMQLFRRRFLHQTIKTRPGVNEMARNAYVASRVEVIQKKCTDANYYDINSSFPFAMKSPAPGKLIQSSRSIPSGDNQIYLAKGRVRVPDDSFLPPLPIREKGRIYFPVGTWDGWFSNIDLELLEEMGGGIERIDEVLSFEPFHDLAEYAETLYEMRRPLDESDPMRTILKLLLNSLYGKFAEQSEKQALYINPGAEFFQRNIKREMVMPGVWLAIEEAEVEHVHVPIAMHITGIARRNLYRYMDRSRESYYCDTDGFACSLDSIFQTGDKLGDLKLEKVIREGLFLAPKLYTMLTDKGKRIVKGKGFSKMSYEDFLRLEEGDNVEIERMVRIRENLRAGRSEPMEKVYEKRFRGSVRPKRFFNPDGSSRPWHVEELRASNDSGEEAV